ncbi:hypothetical protein DFH28DRAFT_1034482 [Melampsora americana]|nr:hypothetical protein DFH28DRAFT_1034482 [Melampsora americana]
MGTRWNLSNPTRKSPARESSTRRSPARKSSTRKSSTRKYSTGKSPTGNLQQGNLQQGNLQQGNLQQGYNNLQRRYTSQPIISGTCSDPKMNLTSQRDATDKLGFPKASWQYSAMDYASCNSLNTLTFSVFPKGDQNSPQQFRIKVREMCCDQKCSENALPSVDCMYGPPGKVLNWNTFWINPCFALPRTQNQTQTQNQNQTQTQTQYQTQNQTQPTPTP